MLNQRCADFMEGALFIKDGKQFKANVTDISLGGSLVALKMSTHAVKMIGPDESIKNGRLICSEKVLGMDITLKKALVKRVYRDQVNDNDQFGLQFYQLDVDVKRELNQWIYRSQRQSLQRANDRKTKTI